MPEIRNYKGSKMIYDHEITLFVNSTYHEKFPSWKDAIRDYSIPSIASAMALIKYGGNITTSIAKSSPLTAQALGLGFLLAYISDGLKEKSFNRDVERVMNEIISKGYGGMRVEYYECQWVSSNGNAISGKYMDMVINWAR